MGGQTNRIDPNTLRFRAFDAGNNVLGTFTAPGNGFVTFLGVLSNAPDIVRVDLDVNGDARGLMIGPVSIQAPTPTSTEPEPGTYALLATGLAVLAARRRAAK